MDIKALVSIASKSTIDTLGMMASTECVPSDLVVKEEDCTWGEVTGIIGLAGPTCQGNFCISFDSSAILGIVSGMLCEDFPDVDDDVLDAVGELTNMISGSIKREIGAAGHVIDMATPVVITGKRVPMTQFSGEKILQVPFQTPAGKFVIELMFSIEELK